MAVEKQTSYHGNPNLKKIGHQHEFTEEQIVEMALCETDVIHFIESWCKIVSLDHGLVPFKLYECQKEKVHTILDNRLVVVMEPRQNGKTIVAAACILWYTLFQQNKTVAILANKGSAAREVLSRYQIMYENLPIWMQQGVLTWNKGNVELENGCNVFTSATTSSGIRGKSINWLYIDEASIIPNTVAEMFFASVYPTISAGETTKILLTSTPLGYNHFWKFWNEADKKNPKYNGFERIFIPYTKIPGRDEKWAAGQLKLLGEVKYNQEVLCQFLGSSNTLISGSALGRMSSVEPIHTAMGLDIHDAPKKDHFYVLIADTALGVGGDNSAFTVIDVTDTPYTISAKYKNKNISPLLFPSVIHKAAVDYNNAFILVETNDIGQGVVNVIYQEFEYENVFTTTTNKNQTLISPGFSKTTTFGVRTNKTVKRQGCFSLKSMIEEQKLLIFDSDIIAELATFVEHNGTWSAEEGNHDDLVMTLVLFGWLTTNQYFREMTDVNIRERMYKEQVQQIESELTPFFIANGEEEQSFVAGNDTWTVVE